MYPLLQTLLANLAVIGLLVFAWTSLLDRMPVTGRELDVALGAMLSVGCLSLMHMPFMVGDGIMVDLRVALLALAGYFAGPLPTFMATIVAGLYRVGVGGDGMVAGTASIVLGAAVGLAARFLDRSRVPGCAAMTFLGLWAGAGNVLCILLLPRAAIGPVFNAASMPLGVLTFGATVISGMALIHDARRREAVASNQMYRSVIEALPDCLSVKDADGRFLLANPATAALMGAASEPDLIGKTDFDFYPADIAAAFRADETAVMAEGRARTFDQPVRFSDGRSGRLTTLKAPLRDQEGRFVALITHNRDVTQFRLLQSEFERQRVLLSEAMAHMADAVVLFDKEQKIVYCNQRYREFFPRTAELRLPGARLRDILLASAAKGEETVPEGVSPEQWADQVAASITKAGDLQFRLADGRWLEARSRPSAGGCLVVLCDITQGKIAEEALRRLNDQLRVLADTDSLTGLTNRRGFDQDLEREWRLARQSGRPLSLLFIDLDRFKAYNDTYGHPAGDACLRQAAGCLRGVLRRPLDVAARYGGEELAAILPDTDLDRAVEIAHDFCLSLRQLGIVHSGSEKGRVTASVGVASGGADTRQLLKWADEALYAAKGAGRDAVRAWRPAELERVRA